METEKLSLEQEVAGLGEIGRLDDGTNLLTFQTFLNIRHLAMRTSLAAFEDKSAEFDEKLLALYRASDHVQFMHVQGERETLLRAKMDETLAEICALLGDDVLNEKDYRLVQLDNEKDNNKMRRLRQQERSIKAKVQAQWTSPLMDGVKDELDEFNKFVNSKVMPVASAVTGFSQVQLKPTLLKTLEEEARALGPPVTEEEGSQLTFNYFVACCKLERRLMDIQCREYIKEMTTRRREAHKKGDLVAYTRCHVEMSQTLGKQRSVIVVRLYSALNVPKALFDKSCEVFFGNPETNKTFDRQMRTLVRELRGAEAVAATQEQCYDALALHFKAKIAHNKQTI